MARTAISDIFATFNVILFYLLSADLKAIPGADSFTE